ncbi:hypothetical protein ACFQ1I_19445 [Kitasatospora arboriphila]
MGRHPEHRGLPRPAQQHRRGDRALLPATAGVDTGVRRLPRLAAHAVRHRDRGLGLARRAARPTGPPGGRGSDLSASLTGAGAGTAFALLPAVARYGQEARPYAFAVLLSLLAGVLLLRCLDGRSGAAWAWYGVTLTLAGAAHLVCLLVLPAHAAAVLTSWIRSRRAAVALNWLLATLLGLASISVLVLRGNSQSKQIAWNNPTRDDLVQLPRDLLGSWPAAAVVLALALLGLWAARRHVGLLAVWALLPPLLTFATADRLHLFLDRYLLFTAAPVVVLAAAAPPGSSPRCAATPPSAVSPSSWRPPCWSASPSSTGRPWRRSGTTRSPSPTTAVRRRCSPPRRSPVTAWSSTASSTPDGPSPTSSATVRPPPT